MLLCSACYVFSSEPDSSTFGLSYAHKEDTYNKEYNKQESNGVYKYGSTTKSYRTLASWYDHLIVQRRRISQGRANWSDVAEFGWIPPYEMIRAFNMKYGREMEEIRQHRAYVQKNRQDELYIRNSQANNK